MKKIIKYFSVALILLMLVLFKISAHVHAEGIDFPCMVRCTTCNGTGFVNCPDCDGTAKDSSGDPCTTCIGVGKTPGKAICTSCSDGWITLPNHKWISATSTTLERCEYCNGTRGDIVVSPETKVTNTFALIEQEIFTNTVVSVGVPFFAHTFVVDKLPENPLPVMMTGTYSTPAVGDIGEDISSVIFNVYYLTTDEKIYICSGTYFCWSDMPEEKLQDFLSYGGIVESVDDIDNSTFDENIYVYFEKPQDNTAYQVQYIYQREEINGMVDMIIKNDVVKGKDYVIQSLENIDVPGVEHDRKWSDRYVYQTTSYAVGDGITLNKNDYDTSSETYINKIYVYVEYRMKGIKYYYQDNVVYTDNNVSWRDAVLWNGSAIDKTNWCQYEKLAYEEKNSKQRIETIQDLQLIYEKMSLEDNYYVEVELVKVHDKYYYGSSIIYKRNNSFLTNTTINKILAENILSCEHTITYIFEDIDYIGNGTKLGTYQYKVKFEDSEEIVKIIVTDKINSDYIYGNNLYFPINERLSTGQIVEDMKRTGLISNTNLSTQFTGRNEASSNFLSGKNNQVGTYSYVVDYESATGESGSTQVFLNILEARVFTTDDPIPEEKDYTKIVENVVVVVVAVGGIALLLYLLFGRKGNKKRRKKW